MICPKTMKDCCDDLCHGSGCLEMEGYPMLSVCDGCGGLIDDEADIYTTCECDADDIDADWCHDCGWDWNACKCSLDYPKAKEAKP